MLMDRQTCPEAAVDEANEPRATPSPHDRSAPNLRDSAPANFGPLKPQKDGLIWSPKV